MTHSQKMWKRYKELKAKEKAFCDWLIRMERLVIWDHCIKCLKELRSLEAKP